MPDKSPILDLPYIQPSQAQKHVTHNEALQILDMLVQPVVEARDQSTPPPAPVAGASFIIPAGATGDWAGQDGALAHYDGTSWIFLMPQPGWRAHVLAEGIEVTYNAGTGWEDDSSDVLEVAQLGISTTPDDTNRLAVASAATLLSHAGAGHQLKLNKATAPDTASLLYQSGWSGRAEMGLAGNDDFSIKVSADGASWIEALRLDAATGQASGDMVQASSHDASAGRLLKVGGFGLGQELGAPLVALDTTVTTGWWAFGSDDTSRPTVGGGAFQVVRFSSVWVSQLIFSSNAQEIYHRRTTDNGANWTGWALTFSQATLLGTVSQSSGDPTGAVIERGSNANGEYVRFADGTQICTHEVSLAYNTAKRLKYAWTYPAAFIAAAAPSGAIDLVDLLANVTPTPGEVGGVMFSSSTTAAVAFWLYSIYGMTEFDATDTIKAQVSAVGRWF